MRLLLDTVAFVWAIGFPQRISRAGLAALEPKSTVVEISAISLSEIAIKQAKGKLNLQHENVFAAIEDLKLRVLPYTARHARQLFGLPLHHADPCDRQIIAQALAENIPVVTPDEKFSLYKGLKIIW
jgi:PIN domain nuclease of toxin-antitoxin system